MEFGRIFLFVLWLGACLWVLFSGLLDSGPGDIKDVHVGMNLWMCLLTFPSGLLVFIGSDFATMPFGNYFGLAWSHHFLLYPFVWGCYFVVGLFQWFVLLPWAVSKLSSRFGALIRCWR
jgi:hypothetical protein